ncbi:MAG: shikimate dehydrogenase [Leptolyngbya sp. SIO4C1]|nr:shikimate dehydrogenase [Leptolyngbya sp. SIO4C1]
MIQGTTQLLGVIGDPVKHSLSPVMHNAAIAALGLDYVYLPLPIAAADLPAAVRGFEAIGLRGFNITIPHKQAILPLLNEVSEVAQAVGAVNTVWRTARGWSGTNTDVMGFLAPLRDRDWQQAPAAVLGNGGAARAVVAACHQLGCPEIWVFGRRSERLQRFIESWQISPLRPRIAGYSWSQLDDYLPQAGLIINATPVGMAPQAAASPLSSEQIAQLPKAAIAYDLIYTPRPTQFLKQAAQAGLETIDGLEMLVQQGAAALEIWVNQPVPIDVMRAALLTQLEG